MKKIVLFNLITLFSFSCFSQLRGEYNGDIAALDFQSSSSIGYSMLTLVDVRYKNSVNTIDNSLQEYLIQFSTPIGNNMGAGLKFSSDRFGYFNKNQIIGSYAYHLHISNYQSISLGTEVSFISTTFYLDDVKSQEGDDQVLQGFDYEPYTTDFSFGLQYSSKKLYLGADIFNLLNQNVGYSQNIKLRAHYIIDNLINKLTFYPSVYFSKTQAYQSKYFFGITGKYLDVLLFNIKYNTNKELFLGGGLLLKNMLVINYTFNYRNSSNYLGNFNTHEIGITVNLPFNKEKDIHRGFSFFETTKHY